MTTNMNNNRIMQSLPLVAAVLGNKYGVQVTIGGSRAFTDGSTINLPSLPLDCDETLVGLARGYIDHESAHIRETNFVSLKNAQLTPLEMHIWNCIEDWRVENKLAGIFPGCRGNFTWLIRHFFSPETEDRGVPSANLIPEWILLTVRSWDVREVAASRDSIGAVLKKRYSGLCERLYPVLNEVRTQCLTTDDSITYAKKIVSLLQSTSKEGRNSQLPKQEGGTVKGDGKGEGAIPTHPERDNDTQEELEKLLSAGEHDLPKAMGDTLSERLAQSFANSKGAVSELQIATVGHKVFRPFPLEEQKEINRAESALKTRLQSTLQASQLKQGRVGRRGHIQANRLSRVMTGNPKLFIRHEEKKAVNTAIHILMDCSGSMRKRMELTSASCFALAKALGSIQGINVGVTAFPANTQGASSNLAGVCPVVAHGDPVHPEFYTKASGGTPMGEAIWWVLQKMVLLKEARKIVLVLTDGFPDCKSNVTASVKAGQSLGIEFYGVGIDFNSITTLFPGHSCSVRELSDLAPAMFTLMKNALIQSKN
ncbi:VWA domain-containing protein [Desulfopila sp. IMCC35006]|uniref:cobaltochelatase CobT-related protein n=1 Tax=Desulfopila sp. IMCC35006 TaxID=2569542 RepID=UPI0010AC6F02|nr:VWA domain-containing protein [Desulfopila sp. IMCC35006]TKB25158.1 VWA domain-containing protein [Desulfopila sp. IMCC35006]